MQLMHQIDMMLTTHCQEMSEREMVIKTQLQARERELSALRVVVQERNTQVRETHQIGNKNMPTK